MEACDCPICGRAEALEQSIVDFWGKEYNCRNCGQFAIIDSSFDVVENLDDCASFLFVGGGERAVGTNECVSTNGAGKHGFSDCESILTTTTDNLKHPINGIICA